MSLSCSCSNDYEYWYYPPDDFSSFEANRRKRCVSCRELINFGDDCLEFECFREPFSDIEERIFGDEVQTANKQMCPKCGEIYLNLESIGYCINLGDNMNDLIAEYWELTDFQPSNHEGSYHAS